MTMHPRYIHDTQRYKTSECTKYNGKIHSRYMTDTFKQVTIHKKYMVSGGIGPIFGGKVALTRYVGPHTVPNTRARCTGDDESAPKTRTRPVGAAQLSRTVTTVPAAFRLAGFFTPRMT